MAWHTCGSQRAVCGSQLSSTMWVPGMKLGSSGLATSTFIHHGVIALAPIIHVLVMIFILKYKRGSFPSMLRSTDFQ